MTPPGQQLLPTVERLLCEAENLRQAARDCASHDVGPLSLAATHSQARYALPGAVKDFRQLYPQVTLSLHQGSPRQIAQMLLNGEADIGIATEAVAEVPELVSFPYYSWHHAVIAPPAHPLHQQPLTLETLADYPIVTYHHGFTGRAQIDRAFADAALAPDIVMAALDADVIKTYVELGLGVGITASQAFNPQRDIGLKALDSEHLFEASTTRLAVRTGHYLRDFAYRFIELCSPELEEDIVRQRIQHAGT